MLELKDYLHGQTVHLLNNCQGTGVISFIQQQETNFFLTNETLLMPMGSILIAQHQSILLLMKHY